MRIEGRHVLPLVRIVRPRTRPLALRPRRHDLEKSLRATSPAVRFMLPSASLPRLPRVRRRGVVASAWWRALAAAACVALVVALGMAESSAWYFDYVNFNATGCRPTPPSSRFSWGPAPLSVSRARRGDGVRRRSTTLGGLTRDVDGISLAYFVAAS